MGTYLKVNFDIREEVTRAATEDEWDRDDTYTSWTLEDVAVVPESGYFDVISSFEVNPGDTLLVVYAVYSTGDSFGRDDCGAMEVIDVFKSADKAAECVKAIENSASRYDSKNVSDASWVREDGSDTKLDYVPWNGYFESLEHVRCELAKVI